MIATVEQLASDGVLAEMQIQFASLIGELDATGDGLVPLAAAMVSQQLSRGHVLLDLAQCAELTLSPPRSPDCARASIFGVRISPPNAPTSE